MNYRLIVILIILISFAHGSRFWAIISNQNSSLTRSNQGFEYHQQLGNLYEQSSIHEDGWGLLYYLNGSFGNGTGEGLENGKILRGEGSLEDSDGYYEFLNDLQWDGMSTSTINDDATCAMAHIRFASSGCGFGTGSVPPGPHPFIMNLTDGRTFTFAHNGTLDKDVLRALITDVWMLMHQEPQTYPESGCGGNWQTDGWEFVIDSELYFFWIMKNILADPNQNVLRGIQKALSHPAFRALDENKNFVLSDGDEIWAFRKAASDDYETYGPQNPDYWHSLYWKEEPPEANFGGYKAVMSQPYPTTDWNLMANNELIYLPRLGDPVSITNFDNINGIESKYLKTGWNWVGFPRLINNNATSSEMVMEPLNYFSEQVHAHPPLERYMTWDSDQQVWNNSELSNFDSKEGYKIQMSDHAPRYYMPVKGAVIDPEAIVTLHPGENWVGYFLPIAKHPTEALPDYVLNHLTSIKAQDWFIIRRNDQFITKIECPPMTERADIECEIFEYGKMYILNMDIQSNLDFSWTFIEDDYPPYPEGIPIIKDNQFSYEELATYQPVVIENMENVENVIELGAFKEGDCVGSELVDGCPINLKVYAEQEDIPNLTYDVIMRNSSGRITGSGMEIIEQKPVAQSLRFENEVAFITLKMVEVTNESINLPETFNGVSANPNPFNPKTTIQFELTKDSWVSLTIYDIIGRKVATLASGNFQQGKYSIDWNGKNRFGNSIASGVYFYNLNGIGEYKRGKLLFLK